MKGILVGAAVVALCAASARADQVTGLTAFHRSGQTFISWTSPPGTGWIYRIYASGSPIVGWHDLNQARLVGAVGDSTWYDRRLSTLTGTIYAFRVDTLAPALRPDQGLFVNTVDYGAQSYYAVTAEAGILVAEDINLTLDGNSLSRPVREKVDAPEPVFQRVLDNRYVVPRIYTLWASDQSTTSCPAMANVPSTPYDCAVATRGGTANQSLLIGLHARGGNFLQGIYGTGHPNECALSLDDPLFNADANTFWYGYHESYDITSDVNTPPTEGVVHPYTLDRVIYTIEWAQRRFGLDRTRTYAYGFSMGGIGSLLIALRRPDLVAAVLTIAPKMDFSFLADPVPASGFNPGNGLRMTTDKLWGEVPVDLPTSDGVSVYSALNDGWMSQALASTAVPPILAFNGKNDIIVGWAEKLPFYRDMEHSRHGGYFFWDPRDHLDNAAAPWSPAQDSWYLYRFRTNLSFPALSNCSTDNDPGDGTPASGDSIGCINCWVEWDTTVVDQNITWSTRLWTRDLPQGSGVVSAPESLHVDVTPRRLQEFKVVKGTTYRYDVIRNIDGALIAQGTFVPDDTDLLTVPGVTVYKTGTTVQIQPLGALGVPVAGSGRLALALSRNPLVGSGSIQLTWPAAGPARLEILDVSGRVVRTLLAAPVAAGPSHVAISTRGLENGIYFVVASQGRERASARAVVLH